jgi:hypothetical protein
MIIAQKRKYMRHLNIVGKKLVDNAKLEVSTGIKVLAKERMPIGYGDLWSKPKMRCNGTRSD